MARLNGLHDGLGGCWSFGWEKVWANILHDQGMSKIELRVATYHRPLLGLMGLVDIKVIASTALGQPRQLSLVPSLGGKSTCQDTDKRKGQGLPCHLIQLECAIAYSLIVSVLQNQRGDFVLRIMIALSLAHRTSFSSCLTFIPRGFDAEISTSS